MSQHTQKAILHTFQEMLRKQPFDKITVSALVAKCEISSNTFYYHYRDIYDLLDTWIHTIQDEYMSELYRGERWQDGLKTLLRDMKANSDLVYHLFNSLSRERLERYVFESTDDTYYELVRRAADGVAIPEEVLHEFVEYNSYSFLGFFLKYLWNRMEGDIDAWVDPVGRIFEDNLRALIEKYKSE
ncbi:MAG: TetR-like C-terminal domain-containing protein [Oscillospiraceae bacterium]